MSSTSSLDGVRLQDGAGNDFILFKLDWRLMTPDFNAKAMFEALFDQFGGTVPFALCALRPDGSWFVYAPTTLADSVGATPLGEVRWGKIPIAYDA